MKISPRNVPRSLELLHPRSLKYLSDSLQSLVSGRLWAQVLLGMALGVGVGILLGPTVGWVEPKTSQMLGNWFAFPGQIFLGLVQMIVIPLVFASVIRGLASSEDINQLRRLGLSSVAYFLATTTIAIVLGLSLAYLIKPGNYMEGRIAPAEISANTGDQQEAADDILDVGLLPGRIVSLLPRNPVGAMVEAEMLQIIIFAVVLGLALISMKPEESKPILALFGSLQVACMVIVRWAMRLAPIAVFGFMAQLASQVGLRALLGLGIYVGTVLSGLLTMFVLFMTLAMVAARISPFRFLRDAREVLLLAFSTSSSAAVMPLSIRTADEKFKVRPSISQFVIPLGATINMNGTAVYQGVATVFLAQVYGIDLGFNELLLVVLTALGASIGSPATPGVGIVILAMVVSSVGIPPAGIALIMGVDRILDMSRTAVNVGGDLVACVLLERWVGGEKTPEEAAELHQELEKRRAETGEDVLVGTNEEILAGDSSLADG